MMLMISRCFESESMMLMISHCFCIWKICRWVESPRTLRFVLGLGWSGSSTYSSYVELHYLGFAMVTIGPESSGTSTRINMAQLLGCVVALTALGSCQSLRFHMKAWHSTIVRIALVHVTVQVWMHGCSITISSSEAWSKWVRNCSFWICLRIFKSSIPIASDVVSRQS
jgi:hypothetical protein